MSEIEELRRDERNLREHREAEEEGLDDGLNGALLDRANLTGLVLGCIEAKFCKQICV